MAFPDVKIQRITEAFWCFTFMSYTLLVLGWNKSQFFDTLSQIFDAVVQWVEQEDWEKNITCSF